MRKNLDLKDIQKIELNLLKEFDKFCDKNNLYYVLCGGTLLGAIRHKGFIPWDDDIDVLMPRPDYEKLLKNLSELNNTLPSYMQFNSWYNNQINFPFIKLVDTRTEIKVDYENPDLAGTHLWIDIFPIDGIPEDENQIIKIFKKSKYYRHILQIKMAQPGEGKSTLKKILKPVLIQLFRPIKYKDLSKSIDDLAKTYDFNNTESIAGIVWGYGPQEKINKKKFMTPIKVEFENHKFNAPSNYDEYLSGLYKDYMQLPPEEDRVVHGITAFLDE